MVQMQADKSHIKRQQILASAHPLILGKGFTAVGLSEILKRAGVPKGSFYHYFKSKEQFGAALLEHYFEDYQLRLDELLGNDGRPAVNRLNAYFDQWMEHQCNDTSQEKCLVVKLSAEVTDLSESMRLALKQGTEQVINRLARCFQEAIDNNEIKTCGRDAQALAEEIYYLWLGATLITKVQRNTDALNRARSSLNLTLGLDN